MGVLEGGEQGSLRRRGLGEQGKKPWVGEGAITKGGTGKGNYKRSVDNNPQRRQGPESQSLWRTRGGGEGEGKTYFRQGGRVSLCCRSTVRGTGGLNDPISHVGRRNR